MKRLILTAFACCIFLLQSHARDGFAIVIDPTSYQEAKAEVTAYAEAIEKVNNLKVYVVQDRWGIPDSIRAELMKLYERKDCPIMGCVLVGDIPVTMIRDGQHMTSAFKMNQANDRKESSVPSDRYYDDFGLKFKSLGRDTDAPYFYYSVTPQSAQRVHSNLISGRIRPTDIGGTSRYQKLRNYLSKATQAKLHPRTMQQMFYFSGQGYISESKVARIDEKAAYYEHFPQLKNSNKNNISYIDHTDQNPVKERFMNELMRKDLDVAILHHHGYWDTEYLNGLGAVRTVREAKEFIIRNCREHLYSAKQRGKNYDSLRIAFQQRFDLPASWLKDAFNDSIAVQDSILEAASDLHLEDFAVYGYRPNVPVVLIDACFCGSYHKDDCIADEYIFQPGGTIAVVANTVNALQDKWSDHLVGLITQGGCVGDLVRFSSYLESHVVGDPTYRFTSVGNYADLDALIQHGKPSTWRKLLKNGLPDEQVLAIEQLYLSGSISSSELYNICRRSPNGIVRLKAFLTLANFKDDNFIKAIIDASQDSYELLQRMAIRYIAASGDERLIPSLVRLSIANNTSDRCNFNAMNALSCYPKDALLKEFARQFDSPETQYIRKDSIRKVIERAIANSADRLTSEIDDLLKPDTQDKTRKFTIRALRNTLPHYKVPVLIEFLKQTKDEELQIMTLECMGWHPYSCQAERMSQTALDFSQDKRLPQTVRDEALKTYNRLHAK